MTGGTVIQNGLRYLQLHISLEQGKDLPGFPLTQMFTQVSLVGQNGFEFELPTYILQFDGDFSDGIDPFLSSGAHQILEIHEQNSSMVVATCHLTGILPAMIHSTKEVWLQSPSSLLRENGMFLTVLGTKQGLSAFRKNIGSIIPGTMKMRISSDIKADWVAAPQLPARRKEVIELAVSMGYYQTPRKCTQREIADALGLRQGTVAEHLQSAEGTIIQSWAEQTRTAG